MRSINVGHTLYYGLTSFLPVDSALFVGSDYWSGIRVPITTPRVGHTSNVKSRLFKTVFIFVDLLVLFTFLKFRYC